MIDNHPPLIVSHTYTTELAALKTAWTLARNFVGEEANVVPPHMTDFVDKFIAFLDKWDPCTHTEIDEKTKQIECLIKVTIAKDLDIYYVEAESYANTLYEQAIKNPRYMEMLDGQSSQQIHIRDHSPKWNKELIEAAATRIRGVDNSGYTDRKKTKADETDWSKWRTCDCVTAAIIYIINGSQAKFSGSKGRAPRPSDLNDEIPEHNVAKKVNDCLGIAKGVVDDPVLFNIMSRLNWKYLGGLTWNTLLAGTAATDGETYDTSTTYVISYATDDKATSYHTVVMKNGAIYDRQGERLDNKIDGKPTYKDLPMEVFEVELPDDYKTPGKTSLAAKLYQDISS